ncbi:recombinase family protein [Klebsiella pneumoniae]|nr:recombinase family protein [Klebsiella pneumoniae]HDN2558475.1 recombinase family protein [Klebsiella pneumoniae]
MIKVSDSDFQISCYNSINYVLFVIFIICLPFGKFMIQFVHGPFGGVNMQVVTYRRVSTERQGRSGLGLEAQTDYIAHAVRQHGWEIIDEFTDEGVSGSLEPMQRNGLRQAIELCKRTGACLLVAKLDRLSRSVLDIATLVEQLPCIKVATMPTADKFQLHLYAALAEQERDFIKQRTSDALASLKARAAAGDELSQQKVQTWSDNIAAAHASGVNRQRSIKVRAVRADAFAATVEDNILAARTRGHTTLQAIANYLNERGITTRRGKRWTPAAVSRVESRFPTPSDRSSM